MEILALIFGLTAAGISLIALLAALGLILPGPTARTQAALEASLGRAFLVGLVNAVFFLALAAILLNLSEAVGAPVLGSILGFLGMLIALVLTLFTLTGLAGFVRLAGTRIGAARSLFLGDLRGGLLLVLAALTPAIGWYLFTPFVLITALGAVLLVLFQRKPKPVAEDS
ncbi:MAG: hypothetical protein JXB85_03805 [Anaerolineales bacterium]|nr:hypothetical protein [Anaerolineales bacterium]